MQSSCARYILITNGEIYNFRSLRKELESAGRGFRGSSDTEVMLEGISEWGLDAAIQKFDGMFAFALWDRRERALHLGRDRFGEKPLYYGWSGHVFLFGSELKALRRHPCFHAVIDRDTLALYIRYGYLPAPYSIYRDIHKVTPGHIVTLRAGRERSDVTTTPYWSARESAERGLTNPFNGSPEDATRELAELLAHSVQLRMESDVPIGAFLSGGYDTSTIVGLMRRAGGAHVSTFTLGFEEADEIPFARQVARHLDTNHTDAYVTSADAQAVVPLIASLYDEPFSDSSQIPTFLVSKLARQHVSVILTGDGGDELFCGYHRYSAERFPGSTPQERIEAYRIHVSQWFEPERIIPGASEPLNTLTRADSHLRMGEICDQVMHLDTITYLPDDLLVKLDRAAMAVSLETRAPFLDHKVHEFAWRLPFGMKVREDKRKWILRQVLYEHVPPELVDRPKQGFEVPLFSWLTGPLREWAAGLLDESRLRREGFFDAAAIQERWQQLLGGRRRFKHLMWTILMFEAWLDFYRKSA